jgi:hypothetical protein
MVAVTVGNEDIVQWAIVLGLFFSRADTSTVIDTDAATPKREDVATRSNTIGASPRRKRNIGHSFALPISVLVNSK